VQKYEFNFNNPNLSVPPIQGVALSDGLGEKEKKISPKKNTVYINFLPLSSKSP
jgi:hypothetical protein